MRAGSSTPWSSSPTAPTTTLGSIGLDALVDELKKLSDPQRPVPLIALAIGPAADTAALDRIVAPTGGSAHQVSDPSQIHQVMLKAIMAAGSKSRAEPPRCWGRPVAPPPRRLPAGTTRRYRPPRPAAAQAHPPRTPPAGGLPASQATGQVCTGSPACISSL